RQGRHGKPHRQQDQAAERRSAPAGATSRPGTRVSRVGRYSGPPRAGETRRWVTVAPEKWSPFPAHREEQNSAYEIHITERRRGLSGFAAVLLQELAEEILSKCLDGGKCVRVMSTCTVAEPLLSALRHPPLQACGQIRRLAHVWKERSAYEPDSPAARCPG